MLKQVKIIHISTAFATSAERIIPFEDHLKPYMEVLLPSVTFCTVTVFAGTVNRLE